MRKIFALMFAAALVAGSSGIVLGEDAPTPRDDSRIAAETEAGDGRGGRRGGGRDGFRRGRAGGRHEGRRFNDHPDFDGPDDHAGRRRFPGGGSRFGWMGMGPGLGGLAGLELTAEQKTGLMDVLTARFRAGLEAGMEMTEAKRTLEELRKDENASFDAIVQANAAVGAARGKLEAVRRQTRVDVRKILTPDQIKKLEERRGILPPPHRWSGDRGFGGHGARRGPGRPRTPGPR